MSTFDEIIFQHKHPEVNPNNTLILDKKYYIKLQLDVTPTVIFDSLINGHVVKHQPDYNDYDEQFPLPIYYRLHHNRLQAFYYSSWKFTDILNLTDCSIWKKL